jgi:hypothetical protein
MSAKFETISKLLRKKYLEDKPEGETPGFVYVNYTQDYELQNFKDLIAKSKRLKTNKKFRAVDIEPINSDIITSISFGISYDPKKKMVKVKDTSGLFKVKFSDGSYMYYAKWLSGFGKNQAVEGMFAAEKEVWKKFLQYYKEQTKVNSKPKIGIHRISMVNTPMGSRLHYSKPEKLNETPVVHQSIETLTNDMNFFYNNLSHFTRFNMPGVRKVMLVGEPGTGKSSICYRVAKRHSKEKCVVFATDIVACAHHLVKCAKHKMSTIVILEDAESTLGRADSSLLNFLDGVDQPINKMGAYIIMTTNFPQRIEPRILKRPGRVDKVIKFGALKDEYVVECAKIYFEGLLFKKEYSKAKNEKLAKEFFEKVLNDDKGMTGAQIKELANASIAFAVSRGEEITVDLIKTVKENMQKDLKDVYELADEESMVGGRVKIGFNEENEKVREYKPSDVFVLKDNDDF